MRDEAKGLGRAQRLVLMLLAANVNAPAKDIRTIASDWPGLTEGTVRSAVEGLARRGLVDAAGWDRGRTYTLTDKGREVEASISQAEDPDEADRD